MDNLIEQLRTVGKIINEDDQKCQTLRLIANNQKYSTTYEVLTTYGYQGSLEDIRAKINEKYILENNGLRHIAAVNDSTPKLNKSNISPPPNNSMKATTGRRLRLLPPKGWRIPNGACYKCGLKHPDSEDKTKCKTKLQNYRWNQMKSKRNSDRHTLFDQNNNNNKKTRQAVISISKIGTTRIYDHNFILDSGSSVHFARLNDIIPGTFRQNRIKY